MGRWGSILVLVFALMYWQSLCASGAAQRPAGKRGGPSKAAPANRGPAELTSPKVPEAGQSAMTWPGLDLAGPIGRFAESADQKLVWSAVAAPGMKSAASGDARTEFYVPAGWTFVPISVTTGQPQAPRAVKLPDQWGDDRDYVAGWYARHLTLTPRPGERLVARFDQVALFCVLYVNGVECGRHLGAYTPFEIDITRAVRSGDNLLALYVHDASGAVGKGKLYNQVGGWKPQENKPYIGGVWGPVRIERHAEAYLGDVFVKTSTRRHELTLACELENAGATPRAAKVDFALLNWPDGSPVPLAIPSRQVLLTPGKTTKLSVTVPWSDPRLWSPDHPNLYVVRATLTPDSPGRRDCLETRFGFREFWAEGQRFLLNGVPVRLFGESHYGPGRDEASSDPVRGRALNREAFLALKDRYRANSFRIHAQIVSGNIALGADEAGCLLINQSSIWSTNASRYRNCGEPFLANTRREFAEWVRRDRNCPSVVIWDVENEQIRMGENNKPWAVKLDAFVREHDDTRIIEHSGAGWYDPQQQIIHLHDEQQFTDIMERWQAKGDRPLIMGEFWVGYQGGEWRPTSSPEFRSRPDYTFEEARLNEEEMLQMRNFGISGIMPFQLSRIVPALSEEANEAPGAKARYGEKAEACARAAHHGLQPLTIFFWPRGVSAAAGEEVRREVVVCNDSETSRDLVAEWSIEGAAPRQVKLKLAPGEQRRIPISFVASAKDFRLTACLLAGNTALAAEELDIRVADAKLLAAPALKRQVIVYEGQRPGAVEKLRQLGVAATVSATVPANAPGAIWVIAPGASDTTLLAQSRAIHDFVTGGGRILCLAQAESPGWSPVHIGVSPALRASPHYYAAIGAPKTGKELLYSCYAPIYAAGHPAFAGIAASDLRLWSPRDGRVADDVLTWPAAAGESSPTAWRVLAGACRPELASLAEARVGQGTIVFCQAQAMEQSQTPEARLVLMNLLRYLDGAAWTAGSGHVALAGALSVANASRLTGVPAAAFSGASPRQGDVLIATDGAAVTELEQWADAGGTVLVLSSEVGRRLPGYALASDEDLVHLGVRGQDHPLLWGVCSESFMGFDKPCIEGVLQKTPESARVLLYGLSAKATSARRGRSRKGNQQLEMFDRAAGPVAVAQPHGKGTWVVTTMAPWHDRTVYDRELLKTLLANAGAAMPLASAPSAAIQVLKTAPLKIDGRLDDWTSDVEDRNVSAYGHAKPIVISSRDVVSGKPRSDADLSAIAYFLWNEKALSLAGAVFGQGGKTTVTVRLDSHILSFVLSGRDVSLQLDGKPAAALRAASGHTISDDLTDARALSLFAGDAPRGEGNREKVPGTTFEIEVPWSALADNKPPEQLQGLIRVERADGTAIQAPAGATPNDPATWLQLILAP